MEGTILHDDQVPKPHPNCNCFATQMPREDFDKKFSGANPKKQAKYEDLKAKAQEWQDAAIRKETVNDKNFEAAYAKLKESEGGYTDGKNQVKDESTNMGIKQSTLDNYSARHPEKEFPSDVKHLQPEQAKEIFKDEYWDKTNIPQIKNDRIRNAVFDMNVMGSVATGQVVQRTLNSYTDAELNVNGKIGSETIGALNSIPKNKIGGFMDELKEKRLESLHKMKNWPTAKGGWTTRTNAY